MAANPIQLSGLARRLVEDNLLEEDAARETAEEGYWWSDYRHVLADLRHG